MRDPLTREYPPDLAQYLSRWLANSLVVAEKLNIPVIVEELQNIGTRFASPDFRLGVVGDIARGKSTFINQLLGGSCQLPTGATPTTATITTIRAGIPERLEIYFPDGQEELRVLKQESWKDLLTSGEGQLRPGEPPHVYMMLDNAWLKDLAIEIIDTPGLNGPDEKGTRANVTAKLLCSCDAIVLVINARFPLSLTEMAFFERIIKEYYISRVLVVVSIRPDDFTQDELPRQMQLIRQRVASISPHIPVFPTYPVNASDDERAVLTTLRAQIGALGAKAERKAWRSRQIAALLAMNLEQIMKIETERETAQQRSLQQQEEARQVLDKEMRQTIQEWDQLHDEFLRRTQHLESKVREKVWEAQRELTKAASLQLLLARDPKGWWERKFPTLALAAFYALGQQSEKLLVHTLIRDMHWLEQEIRQRYHIEHPLTSLPIDKPIEIALAGQELRLHNVELYKSLIKLLPGLASLLAEIALSRFGFPPGDVLPLGKGSDNRQARDTIVDSLWRATVEKQQRIVDQSIKKSIQQSLDEYINRVTARLNEIYEQISQDIHRQQLIWKQAEYATFERREDAGKQERQRLLAEAASLKSWIIETLS